MTFQKPLYKRITSTSTSKPAKPTHSFENPLDRDVSIDTIELTPDTFFRKKGAITIEANGVELVNLGLNDLKNYSVYRVPLQTEKILKRQKEIDCFVWNEVDSQQVAISVNIGVRSD